MSENRIELSSSDFEEDRYVCKNAIASIYAYNIRAKSRNCYNGNYGIYFFAFLETATHDTAIVDGLKNRTTAQGVNPYAVVLLLPRTQT